MTDNNDLRQKAEKLVLAKTPPENISTLSPARVKQMLHELRVHQIELEMQNEELREAQEELYASRTRYFDLYDLAPVGYITLSEQGLILEANLTAVSLLGLVTRRALIRQPMSRFILREDQDIYYGQHKKLFESGELRRCELRLLKKDGSTFWARLDAIAVTDSAGLPTCRMVVSDITGHRKAEEALLEKERLQGVLEMAGAICHELSQPLQVISGFSSILLMDIKESDPLYKPVKGIEAGITRANTLMKRIKGITRYQSKPYLENTIIDIEKASYHEKESPPPLVSRHPDANRTGGTDGKQ